MKRPFAIYLSAILGLWTLVGPVIFLWNAPFYTGTVVGSGLILLVGWAAVALLRNGRLGAGAVLLIWLVWNVPLALFRVPGIVASLAPAYFGWWLEVTGVVAPAAALFALRSRSCVDWLFRDEDGDAWEEDEGETELNSG